MLEPGSSHTAVKRAIPLDHCDLPSVRTTSLRGNSLRTSFHFRCRHFVPVFVTCSHAVEGDRVGEREGEGAESWSCACWRVELVKWPPLRIHRSTLSKLRRCRRLATACCHVTTVLSTLRTFRPVHDHQLACHLASFIGQTTGVFNLLNPGTALPTGTV